MRKANSILAYRFRTDPAWSPRLKRGLAAVRGYIGVLKAEEVWRTLRERLVMTR